MRAILVAVGSVSVAIGTIGAFVPVLPTTPFLLLAAACYLRASDRLYHRLLAHRLFGAYLAAYLRGEGIPLKTKLLALAMLWASLGASALFAVPPRLWWVRLILLAVGAGVTAHLIAVKTRKDE